MAVNKKKGGSWGVSAVIGAVLLFAFLAWVAPAVSTHGGTTAASSQTSSQPCSDRQRSDQPPGLHPGDTAHPVDGRRRASRTEPPPRRRTRH